MPDLVTIFGGGGFVGRHAVRILAKAGYRIRVAIRRPHLVPELITMGSVGQIELLPTNVRDLVSVERALEGASGVVNLVAILYQKGLQRFSTLQTEAPGHIANLAAARGIEKFVHLSAIGASLQSDSLYAKTKALGEVAVLKAFPQATLLRPSVIFGPEDDFFNRFAAMASVSPVLPLIGGGKTRFQPVYVEDVARAILNSLDQSQALGKTYELGGPTIYDFRKILEIIKEVTGRKSLLLPIPWPVAGLIAGFGDVTAALSPLPPVLTTDQLILLKTDNVVDLQYPGLKDLGIIPTPLESIVPSYLWRFRDGGQFAGNPAGQAVQKA